MGRERKRKRQGNVRREAVRITSNYARLLVTVFLGLLLIRLQFQGLGAQAFGLIGLLGSTVGIASMVQQIVRQCIVRELAEVHHVADGESFKRVFNSALLLAVLACVGGAVIFGALLLIVPLLNIPPALQTAARVFIVCKAAESMVVICLTPIRNMELVRERMIAFNIWRTAGRIAHVTAALIVFVIVGVSDPASGVIWYGLASASLFIFAEFLRAGQIVWADRRLVPSPRSADRATTVSLLKIGGWHVTVLLAHNLHHRADAVLINLFLGSAGLFYNAAWTLAVNLASEVRMLSRGMTDGVDAVTARLSLTEKKHAVGDFMRSSTRLNTFAAVPASIAIAALAEPVLWLVLGSRIPDPGVVPVAVTFMQIIAVGVAARAIAENWTRVLYGAGQIRRYAPVMLVGGLLNPVIAVSLFLLLPADSAYLAAPIAFAGSITLVHFLVLPFVAARTIHLRARDMLLPVLPCTLIAAACSPILYFAHRVITDWTIFHLLGVALAYGGVYTALCLVFAVKAEERRRFGKALRRVMSGSKGGGGKVEAGTDPSAAGAEEGALDTFPADPSETPGMTGR